MENQIQIQGDDPKRLDGLTPQQLINEIQQIAQQYDREVPGQRRRWPESIRSRVMALGRFGVPAHRIAELTTIPKATVFLWFKALPRRSNCRRQRSIGTFIKVKDSPTVKQDMDSPTVRLDVQAVLTTPDGFRIEFSGTDRVRALCAAYRELRAVQ
jgi:hypothetical protein